MVVLKFLRLFSARLWRSFKTENHTRNINVLVSLSYSKLRVSLPNSVVNFGFGTLVFIIALQFYYQIPILQRKKILQCNINWFIKAVDEMKWTNDIMIVGLIPHIALL